jgi:hypothetical protein
VLRKPVVDDEQRAVPMRRAIVATSASAAGLTSLR